MMQRGYVHNATKFCTLLVLFHLNTAYPDGNECPSPSHRKFRKAIVCNNTMVENYSCLFDERSKTYKESCADKPDFVRRGQKYVLRGGRDGVDCSESRFQPFNFWSNESSKCMFLKDACSEFGQVVHTNGSTMSDRYCRCDHNKGFIFVVKPKNRCYCIPSHEDCTCMVKSCLTNEILSPDYECIKNNLSTNGFFCDHKRKAKERNTTTPNRTVLKKDKSSSRRISFTAAFTAVLGTSVLIVFGFTLQYTIKKCSFNIVRFHRLFLLEEMDTDEMQLDLQLYLIGDRIEKAMKICPVLEKEDIQKTLERFKNRKMYYIYRRLETTRAIFSYRDDASRLSYYIKGIRHWIDPIVRTNLEELLGILNARNIVSSKQIDCIVRREFKDINKEIDILMDKILQSGKDEMLTLLDALCIILHNKQDRTENPNFATYKDSTVIGIDKILRSYGLWEN